MVRSTFQQLLTSFLFYIHFRNKMVVNVLSTGELMHSRPISQSTRFHTHPLPSRVASPFGGQRSPQASPEGGENMDSVLRETTPISPSLTPPSVFDW